MTRYQTTRLILVRHAQSVANATGRVQGWTDAPLTPHGQREAQHLAAWLRQNNPGIQRIFSSPLQRAYQTASGISSALDLEIETRPGLKEIYLGQLEDSHEDDFNAALNTNIEEFERTYEVETTPAFTERTLGTLHGLLAAHDGSTLLVVTHLGIICTALAYWLDRDVAQAWPRYGHIRNTSLTELVFHERVELRHIDQTPHLEAHS
jgi:broad specificity phosphatase PhoE